MYNSLFSADFNSMNNNYLYTLVKLVEYNHVWMGESQIMLATVRECSQELCVGVGVWRESWAVAGHLRLVMSCMLAIFERPISATNPFDLCDRRCGGSSSRQHTATSHMGDQHMIAALTSTRNSSSSSSTPSSMARRRTGTISSRQQQWHHHLNRCQTGKARRQQQLQQQQQKRRQD